MAQLEYESKVGRRAGVARPLLKFVATPWTPAVLVALAAVLGLTVEMLPGVPARGPKELLGTIVWTGGVWYALARIGQSESATGIKLAKVFVALPTMFFVPGCIAGMWPDLQAVMAYGWTTSAVSRLEMTLWLVGACVCLYALVRVFELFSHRRPDSRSLREAADN